ncbi:MAG: MBG domain-containing protein, partial [Cyclobacteriaceae bacterium]
NIATINGTGEVTIMASQEESDGYFASTTSQRIMVNKKSLLAVAIPQIRSYGDSNADLELSYSGFAYGETANVLDIAPEASTTANELSDVGTYLINLSDGEDNNYDVMENPGTITINKAPLYFVADDQRIVLGEPLPDLSYKIIGFVNDDGVNHITPPTPIVALSGTLAPGEYIISFEGGESTNYEFRFIDGTLTVESIVQVDGFDQSELRIYPNPVVNSLFFENVNNLKIDDISIMNIYGSIIKKLNPGIASHDVSMLRSGVYILAIKRNGKIAFLKFQKNN